MRRILSALLLALVAIRAEAFETSAGSAWVYDVTTGTVLLDKNAHVPLPPASMSKLMTLYMAFEAVRDGRLALDATLPVSEHAMSFGGSSMFLNTNDRPTVEDLLRGIIVLSGNDATVVVAEALSPDGTEAGFARLMTERAEGLGMTDSHFVNASGWPAAGHVMSMADLGVLAVRLIEDFPEFYPMFAETEFAFDGRVPSNTQNRNPILGLGLGADGLKTGHTQEAGYGLVGSAEQEGRRIVFVVSGLASEADRRTESERILNWAFRQFAIRDVGAAGTRLAEAEVWMGAAPTVGLVLPEDLSILVPTTGEGAMTATVAFAAPVAAPVTAGQPLGELRIERAELPPLTLPLVAEGEVARGGFGPRMQTALGVLMRRAGFGAEAPEAPEAAPAAPATGAADGA